LCVFLGGFKFFRGPRFRSVAVENVHECCFPRARAQKQEHPTRFARTRSNSHFCLCDPPIFFVAQTKNTCLFKATLKYKYHSVLHAKEALSKPVHSRCWRVFSGEGGYALAPYTPKKGSPRKRIRAKTNKIIMFLEPCKIVESSCKVVAPSGLGGNLSETWAVVCWRLSATCPGSGHLMTLLILFWVGF
jgi:hypothetical protein